MKKRGRRQVLQCQCRNLPGDQSWWALHLKVEHASGKPLRDWVFFFANIRQALENLVAKGCPTAVRYLTLRTKSNKFESASVAP